MGKQSAGVADRDLKRPSQRKSLKTRFVQAISAAMPTSPGLISKVIRNATESVAALVACYNVETHLVLIKQEQFRRPKEFQLLPADFLL
jgi:hypothetical protein